jgi:hypothetical protein
MFSLLKSVQTGSRTSPASYAICTGVTALQVKRREDDHSPPPSAEVMNGGPIPALPIRSHGVVKGKKIIIIIIR